MCQLIQLVPGPCDRVAGSPHPPATDEEMGEAAWSKLSSLVCHQCAQCWWGPGASSPDCSSSRAVLGPPPSDSKQTQTHRDQGSALRSHSVIGTAKRERSGESCLAAAETPGPETQACPGSRSLGDALT